jgi:hypothetical protein
MGACVGQAAATPNGPIRPIRPIQDTATDSLGIAAARRVWQLFRAGRPSSQGLYEIGIVGHTEL